MFLITVRSLSTGTNVTKYGPTFTLGILFDVPYLEKFSGTGVYLLCHGVAPPAGRQFSITNCMSRGTGRHRIENMDLAVVVVLA